LYCSSSEVSGKSAAGTGTSNPCSGLFACIGAELAASGCSLDPALSRGLSAWKDACGIVGSWPEKCKERLQANASSGC
jgi:hypothetical protein